MLNNLRWNLLPMSLDYSRYLDSVKCSVQDLKNTGFSVGDFEYYLTDKKKIMVDTILVRFIQKKKWIRD